MHPLDYETPQKKKSPGLFWVAFASAYPVGALILNMTDDVLSLRRTGYHSDGGVMILTLIFSPVFALAAELIKDIWKRFESVGFAVAFSILAPLISYLALYLCHFP